MSKQDMPERVWLYGNTAVFNPSHSERGTEYVRADLARQPSEADVTQRDRDAAADYLDSLPPVGMGNEVIRDGIADDHGLVQAFARHRQPSDADVEQWQKPYRSQDAAGGPDTASAVGWAWLNDIAVEQQVMDPDELHIEGGGAHSGGCSVASLYRGTTLLAAATVFRDPMNFAVLLRWKSSALASIGGNHD